MPITVFDHVVEKGKNTQLCNIISFVKILSTLMKELVCFYTKLATENYLQGPPEML